MEGSATSAPITSPGRIGAGFGVCNRYGSLTMLGERLPGRVIDDEALRVLLEDQRRREAACGRPGMI